jgi:hypothetical protein
VEIYNLNPSRYIIYVKGEGEYEKWEEYILGNIKRTE